MSLSYSVVKENLIDGGKRILKVFQFGAKTAVVASNFGDDSHPLEDMIAIYGETTENGESVILGYINKNQIADVGEKRIFSLKEDGSLSFHIHLKNDGTCIINSDADNAVRYSKLEEAFNQLKDDFNTFVTEKYNLHINPANGSAPPNLQGVPSEADITPCKIEEIFVP